MGKASAISPGVFFRIITYQTAAHFPRAGLTNWTIKLCRNQINSRDHWHTMAKANRTYNGNNNIENFGPHMRHLDLYYDSSDHFITGQPSTYLWSSLIDTRSSGNVRSESLHSMKDFCNYFTLQVLMFESILLWTEEVVTNDRQATLWDIFKIHVRSILLYREIGSEYFRKK